MKFFFRQILFTILLFCDLNQLAFAQQDNTNLNFDLSTGTDVFCVKILEVAPIVKLNQSQLAKALELDSKFYIKTMVEDFTKKSRLNFNVGESEYFAVHSPNRMFGKEPENIKDKRYIMRLHWDGKLLPRLIEATLVESCK